MALLRADPASGGDGRLYHLQMPFLLDSKLPSSSIRIKTPAKRHTGVLGWEEWLPQCRSLYLYFTSETPP